MYALQPLFEFQTTIAYLKNPPEGYLFPALDFWAEFEKIVSNVQNGAYNSKCFHLASLFFPPTTDFVHLSLGALWMKMSACASLVSHSTCSFLAFYYIKVAASFLIVTQSMHAACTAADTYTGEYDFQIDISALTRATRDGHFAFSGDATRLFQFSRRITPVSVSLNGTALPQVYNFREFFMALTGRAKNEFTMS